MKRYRVIPGDNGYGIAETENGALLYVFAADLPEREATEIANKLNLSASRGFAPPVPTVKQLAEAEQAITKSDLPDQARSAMQDLLCTHNETDHDLKRLEQSHKSGGAVFRSYVSALCRARDAFNQSVLDLAEHLERFYAPKED